MLYNKGCIFDVILQAVQLKLKFFIEDVIEFKNKKEKVRGIKYKQIWFIKENKNS